MISAPHKVAEIIWLLGDSNRDLSVGEISRHTGREKTQISRMLKSMAEAELVNQNPDTRRYSLSWRLKTLTSNSTDHLIAASQITLQKLVSATREVALLSIQEGNRSLTIARQESDQSLRAGGWIGRRSPMHCTASGRALLYDFTAQDIKEFTQNDFSSADLGEEAPKTLETLLERLRNERKLGYSVATNEIEDGLTSIGAPLRNHQGKIIAALNISGPTSRIAHRSTEIGKLLLKATNFVRQSL